MTAAPPPARPFFLPAGGHEIFALHHDTVGAARGAIVYVPPFTEEMNKSRRMAALQSRALAAAGWQVLQIDPLGTGDSEGGFADARWAAWLDDVAAARAWLAERSGHAPWLWGLRLGALLANASLAQTAGPGLLAWQPVLSGKQHLQQFLRLKAGGQWLSAQGEGEVTAKPIDQLREGVSVEVAGYLLHPGLALPMAETEWQPVPGLQRLVWLEVSPREDATLAPISERALAAARAQGAVHAAVVQGPSFWQALEIEEAPALLQATLEALA